MNRARILGVAAAAVLLGTPAEAYYHYIQYLSRIAPFTPAYAKFNLAALPFQTVTVSVSDAAPKTPGNDSFASVLSQVKQAAAVWNGVSSSDLRIAFGGLEAPAQVSSIPGIDVTFGELAPGVLGEAAPTISQNPVAGPNGTFYPIVGAVVLLNNDTSLAPGPAYTETYFTTAVHELGHALGLQHTFTASAMSVSVTRNTTRTRPLDSDDVAALSVLYGKPGWSAGFGSISGRVTSNGANVSLASVVALPITGSPVSALTNPDGTYRIDGIPSGHQYLVYVHPLPPDADVTLPKDPSGRDFPASRPFETLFYAGLSQAGTRDSGGATPISVSAGGVTPNVNFNVQPRPAAPIYDVVAYSYFDAANRTYSWNGNPVSPAFIDSAQSATEQIGTITFRSISMDSTPVPQSATLLGGFAPAFQVNACCTPQSVVMYFKMPWAAGAGPRHLVLNYGNDMYVLPDAINLVQKNPPSISAAANDDGSVTVSGANLNSDSRIFFDGLPAAVKTPFNGDGSDGSIAVIPPPGFGGQTATITVFNPDGQNSMTLESVNLAAGLAPATAPPTYAYPASDPPQIDVTPLSLPAGALTKIEITASNMNFVDGQVTVGFGTDDVTVRRVWALSPTHLIADVVVAPNAALGTSEVSVISGFQVASLANAFQIQPADSSRPAIVSIANGVSTQATLYPAGYVSLYGVNLAAAGATPQMTLNDTPIALAYFSPDQINFQIPPAFSTGPAILKLYNGSNDALPVVLQISPAPPVITGVTLTSGQALDPVLPVESGYVLNVQVTGLDPTAAADLTRVRVTAGSANMSVFQITPNQDGSYQIQIALTQPPAGAQVPLAVWVDGSSSAPYFIAVK